VEGEDGDLQTGTFSHAGKHGVNLTHAANIQSINSSALEPVGKTFLCGEKLLTSFPPAEIHFSKEIRLRCCCYSNSQSHLHSLFPQPHSDFCGQQFHFFRGSDRG
jgi:hypothetical protein